MGWFVGGLRTTGKNCFYGVLGVGFRSFSFLFFYCGALCILRVYADVTFGLLIYSHFYLLKKIT